MDPIDDFVHQVMVYVNPNFRFPGVTDPGLPNFALGCFSATFAGISYALNYLPPSPTNVPQLPSIGIFTQAFMGSIKMPSSYPAFSFGPLTIPGVGAGPYKYHIDSEMKLIGVSILLPFKLTENLITGIIKLQVPLPTVDGIQVIFNQLCVSVGINTPAVAKFGGGIAESTASLFSELIKV